MPTRRDEGSRVRAGEHAVSTQHAGAHMFVVTVVVVRVTSPVRIHIHIS